MSEILFSTPDVSSLMQGFHWQELSFPETWGFHLQQRSFFVRVAMSVCTYEHMSDEDIKEGGETKPRERPS